MHAVAGVLHCMHTVPGLSSIELMKTETEMLLHRSITMLVDLCNSLWTFVIGYIVGLFCSLSLVGLFSLVSIVCLFSMQQSTIAEAHNATGSYTTGTAVSYVVKRGS